MLLKDKTKSRALTMMFVPHYDSPVRVLRLSYVAVYMILVVLVLSGTMIFQLVFRYNKMQANIETLKQGSNRRLVDLQREMISDYAGRLSNLENKFAVVSEYLDYLNTLDDDVLKSAGYILNSNGSESPVTLEQMAMANNLKFEHNPKPASYAPQAMQNLDKVSDDVEKKTKEHTRSLAIMQSYANEYNDLRERTPTSWPCDGRFTSFFGWRNWTGTFHEGIDIVAPEGTPLHATASGEVIKAESYFGYGLCVDILHRDGIVTRYGHCSKILVEKGEFIRAGQVVALCGNTGNSDIPHCHYEIRINDKAVDPLKFPF